MKRLKLTQLKIKSFIIEQSKNDQLTIKSGLNIGSDGPPYTSSRHTEVYCDVVPESQPYADTQFCDFNTNIKTCSKG